MTEHQVFDNLKQYGRIVYICKDGLDRYRLDLQTDAPIKQAIPASTICIEGIDYEFNLLNSSHRHRHMGKNIPVPLSLLPAANQQSSHHILNILYDDVLRMIFEDPRYDLRQLVAIANVCTQFQRIAGDIFTARYKGITVHREMNCPPIADFLHAFGTLVSTIDLTATCAPITLRLVLNHCEDVEEIACTFNNGNCNLPQLRCPRLTRLSLSDTYDMQTTVPFFALNPQLEQFTLDQVNISFGFEEIFRHLPNLTAVCLTSVDATWNDVKSFGQLKYLKSLRLENVPVEAIQRILNVLLAGEVHLERLDLDVESNNNIDLVRSICQLKSIKQLRINLIDDSSLMYLCRNLKHLCEITVMWGDVTIQGLRNALNQSKQLKKAWFHTMPSDDTINADDIDAIEMMRAKRTIDLAVCMLGDRYIRQVSIVCLVNKIFEWKRVNKKYTNIYIRTDIHMVEHRWDRIVER